MWKIHVMQQLFEAQDRFFRKNKKTIFRYGPGECVYQISGLCRFSLGPKGTVQTDKQTESQTHIYTSELKKTDSLSFFPSVLTYPFLQILLLSSVFSLVSVVSSVSCILSSNKSLFVFIHVNSMSEPKT